MTRMILVQDAPRHDGAPPDSGQEPALAVLDGRVLVDFAASPPSGGTRPAPGRIALARIERVLPGGRGAFAAIGDDVGDGTGVGDGAGGSTVFLKDAGRYRGGETLPVMVVGYAEPGKAAPATSRPLVKRRHAILTPGAPGVNLSRAIPAPEREALALAVERAVSLLEERMPGSGAILRTHAARVSEEQLIAELDEAIDEWRDLEERAGGGFIGSGPHGALLDHWATGAVADMRGENGAGGLEILFCGAKARERMARMANSPAFADLHDRLRVFDPAREGGADAFDAFQVREQLRLAAGEIALPSGGSAIVEPTRALVAVDVNSKGNFSDGAAMTANIETCRDLARILRLRGLGGQIVVDFAPLRKAHRRRIEETLKAAFRKCPVETSLAGWTPLGCFELQRKRERLPI